jgi:Zn-dependent protease
MGLTTYIVLLFSLSFHEAAHAWAALQLGDDTALKEGRITLNPIAHIDPLGTVALPLIMFLTAGTPLFGWAKPTPYNPANFRRDHSMAAGHMLVAGAGPLSNLILAVLFTVALFFAVRTGLVQTNQDPAMKLLGAGVYINVLLAVFNLVPLPPLDGSKVAAWGLPRNLADVYVRWVEPYGSWILLLLFASGILWTVLSPFIRVITALLYSLVR